MEYFNKTKIRCCDTIYGRYVRLHLTGPQYLSVCEVQVFGDGKKILIINK